MYGPCSKVPTFYGTMWQQLRVEYKWSLEIIDRQNIILFDLNIYFTQLMNFSSFITGMAMHEDDSKVATCQGEMRQQLENDFMQEL